MNYKKYVYIFMLLIFFLGFTSNMYFSYIGYDAYEAKEKTAIIFWIMGIFGYIGIRVYHFIKERK